MKTEIGIVGAGKILNNPLETYWFSEGADGAFFEIAGRRDGFDPLRVRRRGDP